MCGGEKTKKENMMEVIKKESTYQKQEESVLQERADRIKERGYKTEETRG